jgi:tRNA(fMet)-specific endonuclease VapC
VKYLLDTDHISFLQRPSAPEHAILTARIAQHQPADFAFSIISFHEQMVGAHTFVSRPRAPAEVVRGYRLLLDILQSFTPALVLPFDAAAATVFDQLQAQRVRLATMDARIAAIALSRSLVLLTRNAQDFCRAPGLVTENWTV